MEDFDNRVKAYKIVSYAAVIFSTIAVLSICVTLPMVYTYVSQIKRQMSNEIVYCKVFIFGFTKNFNSLIFILIYQFTL